MAEPDIDGQEIKLIRVVHSSQPLAILASRRGLRPLQRHGQFLVAADAPTVLRRTGAATAEADGEENVSRQRHHPLHRQLMLPIIPKVVGVPKPASLAEGQLVEGEGPWIRDRRIAVLGIRILVPRLTDLKLVEMVVLPAHNRLQDLVQVVERAPTRDGDPPPDRGLDLG
jgi:hypothetical protein